MIETKNASIDTLAVTILALHVSGKQMTQAVFKQLPEGVEKEGDPLWGVVRYQVKDDYNLWLVFSGGERLFRRGLDIGISAYRNGVPRATEELRKHDARFRLYTFHPDHASRAEKTAEDRRLLVLDLEEAQDFWREELARQAKDVALSKLRQLFIAV